MDRENGRAAFSLANGPSIPEEMIFGRSQAMQLVRRTVERVAQASVPLLIHGESGTGKEVIAHEVHRRSPWSSGPFVKVSCPAIPGTLLESELFGYEKGAFTGAWNSKPGRVELAHKGTLFLDEIAEMDPSLQAKLLQLLQDGQFSRIGGQGDCQVDVRIICATNRQLEVEVAGGSFRQDLFYRINVVNIRLPSLRERCDDIPDLAHYFLSVYNNQHSRQVRAFSPELLQIMCRYDWPGNIRELENQVRRYVIMDSEDVILRELMSERPSHPRLEAFDKGFLPLKVYTKRIVQEIERDLIFKVLNENHWNRKKAARVLQISYRALLYKIKKAGLPSKHSRTPSPVQADGSMQA